MYIWLKSQICHTVHIAEPGSPQPMGGGTTQDGGGTVLLVGACGIFGGLDGSTQHCSTQHCSLPGGRHNTTEGWISVSHPHIQNFC